MTTFDFSPLYRSAIGFDHIASLLNNASRVDRNQPSYPPYNVELLNENQYKITMAVAGFSESELDIQTEHNTLSIQGNKTTASTQGKFLHQGIAARNFERRFQLADHVKIENAKLENGLLSIDLVREIPEAMKPKKISINLHKIINEKRAAA